MERLIRLAIVAWSEMRLVERFGPKMAGAMVCALFAFFALLAATGLGVAAVWISIADASGPIAASLWSALVFLVIAAGLLIGMKVVLGSGHHPHAPRTGVAHGASVANDELMASLHKTIGDNKTAALISAVLAGLMIGTQQRR